MANVLTNLGRAILSSRLFGGGTEPKQIAIGSGAGTSAATDTSLFSEITPGGATTGSRTAGTSSQQTTAVNNDTYQVAGTITATSAISVTNAGLFDNSTIGSGTLFMKGDFSAVPLNPNDTLALTFKLQFA